jgi:hypothetical protein
VRVRFLQALLRSQLPWLWRAPRTPFSHTAADCACVLLCASQVKDLGSGNFGLARLEREIATGELVAIKYIERGDGVRLLCAAPRTKCGAATAGTRANTQRLPPVRVRAQRLARPPPPARRAVCTRRARGGSTPRRGAGARRLPATRTWAPTSALGSVNERAPPALALA